MKVDKSKEFDKQFTKEHKRLLNIFGNVNKDTLSVADAVIVQAARLKVLHDDACEDIKQNGEYEESTQSENTPSDERERPISKIFTQRQGAYHKAISELLKLLPEEEQEQKRESLLRSEERRVGKECRYRGLVYGKKEQENKKKRRHKARIKITP